jgi:hypothetical protein
LDTPPSPIAKCNTRVIVLGVPRGALALYSIPGIDKPNAIGPVCGEFRGGAIPLEDGRARAVDGVAHLKTREELHPACRSAIHAEALEWVRRAREEGGLGEVERRGGWFATPREEHPAEPGAVRALAVGAGLDDRVQVPPAGERAERAGEVAHRAH